MKLLAIILLSLSATAVYAACSTSMVTVNGKTIVCTTCCAGTFCNTICN